MLYLLWVDADVPADTNLGSQVASRATGVGYLCAVRTASIELHAAATAILLRYAHFSLSITNPSFAARLQLIVEPPESIGRLDAIAPLIRHIRLDFASDRKSVV